MSEDNLISLDGLADSSSMAGITVAVAGGAGFIGSHLTEFLLHKGASCMIIGRTETPRNLLHVLDKITYKKADLRNKSVLPVNPASGNHRRGRKTHMGPEMILVLKQLMLYLA